MTTRSALLPTASAILFAVAGLIDIAFLAGIGSDDAPLPVIVMFALLGAGTLAALVPARRGSRPALITVVALRVVSALLAIVPFVTESPLWVRVLEAVVIVSTVVGLVLLRRRPALTAAA
ncbi:hypothetical protein AB0M20_12105 [Actinoplanes sp. NPDC051633]|uniref:hypothetical protein n=1 Tax=Actinoplanes sp. NPDC051633 TaxID=3155670 RepID=UPI00344976D1